MNGRTEGLGAVVSGGTRLMHTVRATCRRGKSVAGQLAEGSCLVARCRYLIGSAGLHIPIVL